MFVALDPFLVFFSGLLLTETLFAVSLLAAWYFVVATAQADAGVRWRDAIGAGLLLTLCVLLRPSAVVLVVFAVMLIAVGRGAKRKRLARAWVILAVVVMGLFPWALRNRATIGQWRWLTTRGGISLYDGLREGATGNSDLAHTKTMSDVAGLSETAWDAYFRSAAIRAAQSDPMRVVKLAGSKFLRTWSLIPNVEAYRRGSAAVAGAAFMVLALATAAVGWWRCRRSAYRWIVLLTPVVAITCMHMVFVGSVRYRVPVMPFVVVLSGAGLVQMWSCRRRRSVVDTEATT